MSLLYYPALAALLLVAVYLFLRWFERANVWIPNDRDNGTPADVGLSFEEVWLTAEDGSRLHAWYVPAENAVASLLFCHGNAGNITHRLHSLQQFHSIHVNVLVFDYRGYGKSEGKLSEEGTYRDALAAYHWLSEREKELPLVLFGRSMGAAIATELATRVAADALIFESGFTSILNIGRELFPFLPVRLINAVKYDSISKIKKIKIPLMVIHSPDDDIIPYHHGEAIFRAANEPKTFYNLSGTHNEGHFESEDEYLQAVSTFIREKTAL